MKFIKKIIHSFINKSAPNNYSFSNHPEKLFYSQWGYANTTKDLTADQKMNIFLHFQYSEKAKVALSVASSYPGGHYLEFGSHDLYTLRNFLTAFDVGNLNSRYPNTKFYAFDIFGSYSNTKYFNDGELYEKSKEYFDDFTLQGDMVPSYKKFLEKFNVFNERTFLVKGFFEDTLKDFELDDKIGFACLDCNIVQSYNYVLSWLENKISDGTYLYFDEYFDSSPVNKSIENFRERLLDKYKIKLYFVRSAGSVGALFRCFKL